MVLGEPIRLLVSLKSKGILVEESIVNDMELDLFSTSSRSMIAKSISITNGGVTMQSKGVFLIEVSGDDTLTLPCAGSGRLEGWLMPVKKKIVFKLGEIIK